MNVIGVKPYAPTWRHPRLVSKNTLVFTQQGARLQNEHGLAFHVLINASVCITLRRAWCRQRCIGGKPRSERTHNAHQVADEGQQDGRHHGQHHIQAAQHEARRERPCSDGWAPVGQAALHGLKYGVTVNLRPSARDDRICTVYYV